MTDSNELILKLVGTCPSVPLITDLLSEHVLIQFLHGLFNQTGLTCVLVQRDGASIAREGDRWASAEERESVKGMAIGLALGRGVKNGQVVPGTELGLDYTSQLVAAGLISGETLLIHPVSIAMEDGRKATDRPIGLVYAIGTLQNGQATGDSFPSLQPLSVSAQRVAQAVAALSECICRIHRHTERETAFAAVNKCTDILEARIHGALERERVSHDPVNEFRQPVESVLQVLTSVFGLRVNCIYRLMPEPEGVEALVYAANPPLRRGYKVKHEGTDLVNRNRGVSVLHPTDLSRFRDDPLGDKIKRAVVESSNDCFVVVLFGSDTAGHYLWLLAESYEGWRLTRECVGTAFSGMIEGLATRLLRDLEDIHLVNEIRAKRDKVVEQRRQLEDRKRSTEQLIVRMAHLVSRPLVEANLTVRAFVNRPHSKVPRDQLLACLVEIGSAASIFRGFARVASPDLGTSLGEPKSTPLGVLLSDALEKVRPLAQVNRRPFETPAEFPEDNVLVRPQLVSEIIENLLHNAVKYSLGGRPVEIAVSRDAKFTHIDFTNYGCGIDEDERELIFEQEYRSKHTRLVEAEGTGLGLFVAKKCAELDNASLELACNEPFDTVDHKDGFAVDRYKIVFRLGLPTI